MVLGEINGVKVLIRWLVSAVYLALTLGLAHLRQARNISNKDDSTVQWLGQEVGHS